MSDQTTREAAARAWWVSDREEDETSAFEDAIDNPDGWWFMPTGDDSGCGGGRLRAVEAWLAWAKSDAANAAPVAPDPLAGVVFVDAAKVVAWLGGDAWAAWAIPGEVSVDDATMAQRAMYEIRGLGYAGFPTLWPLPCRAVVLAHARAQLAREAHDATSVECNACGAILDMSAVGAHCCPTPDRYAAPEASLVAPAVTLDAAREAAKAHGYRLVHESGHDDPSAVLAALIVGASLSEDDAMTVTMALSSEEHARTGIARLRALGVTPAVLK